MTDALDVVTYSINPTYRDPKPPTRIVAWNKA